jgi:adenylylsulfate kinase-like enzyme
MIYWFIGQPGSGKTTLAQEFKYYLSRVDHINAIHIDGDDLREIFQVGYKPDVMTPEWRKEQTRALQRMVAYLADQDQTIIVSTVNGYRDVREEFKQSRDDVMEIYVSKKDDRGRESFNIPGYEVPLENFVNIDTTGKTPEECIGEWRGEKY